MIRSATPPDYDRLGEIMFTAIHTGPSPYTNAQAHAWLAAPNGGPDWHRRLSQQYVVLATVNAAPAGFMTLRPDGYLDLAFILPAARGQGLFRALYTAVQTHAKAQNLPRIHTHASLIAQAPFAAMGFQLVTHETVQRAGQTLARAVMEKRL